MDQIRHQIRRARLRLLLGHMITSMTWCTVATLFVALLAIAIPKIWPVGLADGAAWSGAWLVGAIVTGMLGGVVWAIVRQRSELDAAIEIDLRFGLKERVSSAYALSPEQLNSEAGRELLFDAQHRVARIDVGEHFRPQLTWHPLLPLVIFLSAFLIAFLVPDASRDAVAANQSTQQDNEQLRKSIEALKKRLEQKKKQAEATGLKDADTMITKLERAVDELSRRDVGRDKALVKLNNLTKELSERRAGVEGSKKTRDMLKQLPDSQRGPAERVTDALKQGDMEKAMEELKKLSDKLRSDELTAQEKQQLVEQLEQLRSELEKMLGARQELADKKSALQRQIDQLKSEGKQAEAGELQQKMDELQKQIDALDRQNPQLNQLQQLADKLGQCAECMKQGQGQQAADQLDQLANELQQLRDQLDSLQALDEMMTEIADAKGAMSCQQCQGEGCGACQSMGMNAAGDQFSEKPGRGMGQGQGMGDRPEEETETGGYQARVAGSPRAGEAVKVGDASGPNIAGQSREEVKQEIESSFSEESAPIIHQQLPRREREQTREYFELLRKGD